MILTKILKISLTMMVIFFLNSCKDDVIENLNKSYNLSVSPKSHVFDAAGGELEIEIVATVGGGGKSLENVDYKATISGEGFSLLGNKIIAEKNEGPRRSGKLTVTIEGSDLERIVELIQNGDETDPLPGSILEFTFLGVEAEIEINEYAIHALLPTTADITSLMPNIKLSENTIFVDFENDIPIDFTNPVEIKVMGTDNITHTYVVTVGYGSTGFSNVVEKFTILSSNFSGPFNVANRIQSMAVSGNQILLKTSFVGAPINNGNILYYNALTGAAEGQLPTHHGINRMATDSQGRIVGTSLTSVGGTMSLFTLENVTSSRATFYSDTYTGEANTQFGNGGPVNVYGDIKQNAIIYTPISRPNKTPIVHRWVIENGILTASSPELVSYGEYATPPRYTAYGNVGFGIPGGPKITDGYVFGDREEFAYHHNGEKYIFKDEDTGSWTYGGPGGGKVFTMNGRKYFAVWRANTGNGGFFNILDITNPAAIAMTEAERTAAGIDFIKYESNIFDEILGPNNNLWGNIDIKHLDNGNVMLYFMYNNAGVRAYELIKNQ